MSMLQDILDEQYGGILEFYYVFFTFETWSPFTSIIWEVTATPFSCETPAVFCELKNFNRPSMHMRVSG